MSERYQTIKILRETHRLLKVLAAKTGESMLDLIDRLAKQEEQRQDAQQHDKPTDR